MKKIIIILLLLGIIVGVFSIVNHCLDQKNKFSVLKEIYDSMVEVTGGKFTIGKDYNAINVVDIIKQHNTEKHVVALDEEYKIYLDKKYEAPADTSVGSFFMNKYVVTQKQWKAVMGDNPIIVGYGTEQNNDWSRWCRKTLAHWVSFLMDTTKMQYTGVGDDYPIYYVSWSDANRFIDKLNKLSEKYEAKLKTKYKDSAEFKILVFHLPTEVQWEYAARKSRNSDTTYKDYIFSGSNTAEQVAWFLHNSNGEVHKVGDLTPNAIELYDMSGNVFEWCADIGIRHYQTDSLLYDTRYRVLRGGSYLLDIYCSRVSYRGCGLYPNEDAPEPDIGFRLAAKIKD
ncbi:MAG: formylglycine-generating enzyme family protein [Bacteroidales bacterium]|nr:formylglycine-generating enzyme family protein [Bacteroidales bacterium]